MSRKLITVLISLAAVSGCSGTAGTPRHFAVPEGAQNPLVLRYSGATVEEMVNAVAQMCANVPISTAQVMPANGYVETRWSDLADFNLGSQVGTLPVSERFVVYAFQVKGISDNEGVLQIGGWYQPTAPRGRFSSARLAIRSSLSGGTPRLPDDPAVRLALEEQHLPGEGHYGSRAGARRSVGDRQNNP